MRKELMFISAVVLVAIPLTITAASASATKGEVFHGAFAEGAWQTSSTAFGFSLVSREKDGTTHLSVHQFSNVTLDADGNVVSGTEIAGETTAGVQFTIDTLHYASASVSGVIPVHACTIVDGIETDCGLDGSAGSVRFAAEWTGIGPIPHFPSTDLSWQDGCLFVDRNSSVEREATLTIGTLTLNGTSITATPTGSAGFGKGLSWVTTVCPGG